MNLTGGLVVVLGEGGGVNVVKEAAVSGCRTRRVGCGCGVLPLGGVCVLWWREVERGVGGGMVIIIEAKCANDEMEEGEWAVGHISTGSGGGAGTPKERRKRKRSSNGNAMHRVFSFSC